MGCPQAKVTNQRQGRACMSPALCPVIGQEKPVGREAPVGNGGGSRRTASGAISLLRSCSRWAENAFQGHPHSPCAARGGFLYAGLAAAPYPFWLVSYWRRFVGLRPPLLLLLPSSTAHSTFPHPLRSPWQIMGAYLVVGPTLSCLLGNHMFLGLKLLHLLILSSIGGREYQQIPKWIGKFPHISLPVAYTVQTQTYCSCWSERVTTDRKLIFLLACWALDTISPKCFASRGNLDFTGPDCVLFNPVSSEFQGQENLQEVAGSEGKWSCHCTHPLLPRLADFSYWDTAS